MKVLWFSNTPGLAAEYLNKPIYKGGWISAIQAEIEKTSVCDLGFVFYDNEMDSEFTYGKTTYFPIKSIRKKNKYARFFQRMNSEVEYDENLGNFLKIIKKFNPDIIHIYGTENPFGLITKKVKDIPIVIWIQGVLNVYEHKFFSGIDKESAFRMVKGLHNNTKQNFSRFVKKAKIEKEILCHCSHVIGRTDWDRRVARILAPKADYYFVNDLARPSFYSKKWELNEYKTPTFFTTSGPSHYKGFETVLDAAILLKSVNYGFQWIVAGLDTEDTIVRLSMKQRSVDNLDAFNIVLIGKMQEESLVKNMLNAHIYVQVSHIENNPNSLFEAMLLGMPVIASHAGGTANLICNDEDGILVQDGDPYVLAGALIELAEKKDKLIQLGNNAYEVSHKRHDPNNVMDQLMNVYHEIVELSKQPEVKFL